MRFVDFSKPDPAQERVERFMIAAQRAMAEGDMSWPHSGSCMHAMPNRGM